VAKAEFDVKLTELENVTGSFQQYQDGSDHGAVAEMARKVKQELDEANARAKLINSRQQLAHLEDITDYTPLVQMTKGFKPYYDLWTVVDEWVTRHHSWLNDPFDELDSGEVEETVENANKTMASVQRYFKDKELPGILKIAEETKAAVDEFKP